MRVFKISKEMSNQSRNKKDKAKEFQTLDLFQSQLKMMEASPNLQ